MFVTSAVIDERVREIFENVKLPFLDFLLSIITNFSVVLILFLAIPSIIIYKKDKKIFYLLMLSFICAFLFSFALKLITERIRPTDTVYYPLINIINYSFPSMHAMVVFALVPLIIYFMPRQKYFWISLAVLVSFTRIYFNFHYLSDVVFGVIVGYLIGEIFVKLHNKGILWKN